MNPLPSFATVLLMPDEKAAVRRLADRHGRRSTGEAERGADGDEVLLAWARVRLRATSDSDLVERWARLSDLDDAASTPPAGEGDDAVR